MTVLPGIILHFIGASSASVCYTPQSKTQQWSWQTYWLAQAFICWLMLPIVVATITIPNLNDVLSEAPVSAMRNAFLLGALYGIGGTAFGLAIKYVGFSLTYAISVGISCVLGTLLPPLYDGNLSVIFSGKGYGYILSGISAGAAGIALCGIAGKQKERDYSTLNIPAKKGYSFSIGISLCILAGILSALYGFSLAQGQPIADVAEKYGAGNFQVNVIYLFSNSGAFLTTLLYCCYLHHKQKTFSEYIKLSGGSAHVTSKNPLLINYILAAITGILWYTQFFFYGLGHMRMGAYKFTSWAIHMIMLVLISTVIGIVLKEWNGVKKKTRLILASALIILVSAVLMLTYGNHLGEA